MAHKKGQGSTRNGRDSPGQRRGIKVFAGQLARAGNIIVRRDFTIFSKIEGIVRYERVGKDRKRVSVYPQQTAAPAPVQ